MTSSVAKTCFDAIRAKQSAVSAGYDPMVVENQGVYEDLLLRAVDSASTEGEDSKQKGKARTRRQTPLVNAGYASRVLSISYTIRSFVSYQKLISTTLQQDDTKPRRRIRIVLLGCGVDVIGFWARSLVNEDDNLWLTIVEIDKPEVCEVKQTMVTKQGMVKNLVERFTQESTGSKKVEKNYFVGNIGCDTCPDHSDEVDYILVPGDLNDTSSLESIITRHDDDGKEEIPTLVVSELVLSYLPPNSTDNLLSWCASRLCTTPDSAFVSLEPLGSPATISSDSSAPATADSGSRCVISVEEGYRQDYCQKFVDKMERGRAIRTRNAIESIPSNPLFHPIGSSLDRISSRLTQAGFSSGSCTANLGVTSSAASASASRSDCDQNDAKTLVCPDIFDEHAALILHLKSYVLACGFVAPKTQHLDDLLFHCMLCPWASCRDTRPDLALLRTGFPKIDSKGGIVYNEIEVSNEAAVRTLFQNTYGKDYTEKYPAIRKMVKGVLNSDMRETTVASTQPDNAGEGSESTGNSSFIGNFYRKSGGIFLVATKYSAQPEEKTGDDLGRNIRSNLRREVVGCVGIRSYKGKDADPTSTFEIFRLAVATNHRGQGIGKNLLRFVETYEKERQKGRRPLKFVVNTLTILEGAVNLYEHFGYQAEKETPLGSELVLRTYAKKMDVK